MLLIQAKNCSNLPRYSELGTRETVFKHTPMGSMGLVRILYKSISHLVDVYGKVAW